MSRCGCLKPHMSESTNIFTVSPSMEKRAAKQLFTIPSSSLKKFSRCSGKSTYVTLSISSVLLNTPAITFGTCMLMSSFNFNTHDVITDNTSGFRAAGMLAA